MLSRRALTKVLFVSLVAGGLLGWGPTAQGADGKIEAGKPVSTAKPKAAWKGRGRVVGAFRSAPAFKVTVLDAAKKVVGTSLVPAGAKSYEVQWLDPGVYSMQVTAEGYSPLQLDSLEVRANQDLRIDLEFTK
jgi:hypothetical protein